MKTSKRFLAPAFLERFDNWLLLHKPETWSARTHLVAYYGGGFILVLALLAYIFPDDPRTASGAANWALFTSIITIIALVVWLRYLLRFNVFKRYGLSNAADRLKTWLLCFLATAIIMIIPFVQSMVESCKANAAFPDNEVMRDINNINLGITRLEHDSLEHRWHRDTVRVRDSVAGRTRYPPAPPSESVEIAATQVTVVAPKGMSLIDTAELRQKLELADSTEQIDDSTWVFLECPQYVFVNTYQLDDYATEKRLESVDIYRQVVQHYTPPDREAEFSRVFELLKKYENPDIDRTRYYDQGGWYNHLRTISKRYSLDDVDEGLRHLVGRKNTWRGTGFQVLIRIFLYFTVIISLLVFVFRHSTVRTFFLSLLAACILAILTALLLALAQSHYSGFLVMLLFYFVVFGLVAAMAWRARTRSVVTGIAINLFVLLMPFVPLLITSLYYSSIDERYPLHPQEDHRDFWYPFAEVAGPVVLLVMIPVLIHTLYRRWYALPEE